MAPRSGQRAQGAPRRGAPRRRALGLPPVRLRAPLLVMVLIVVLIGGRLAWLQVLNAQEWKDRAIRERTVRQTVPALRGRILDRDGAVLAMTVQKYTLWVNQRQVSQYLEDDEKATIKGVPAAARALAPVLGMTVEQTQRELTGNNPYRVLRRGADPDVRAAVLALHIPGVGADLTADRVYPAGQVGGSVTGFVAGDQKAFAGVELSQDRLLKGRPGELSYERGAGGQAIPAGQRVSVPPVNGSDVVLTIDRDLQWKAQSELSAAVSKYGGSGGSVVALNVHTGEILALVDYPTYDPNAPGRTKPEHRRAQSISNVFEPGSTGKLFTMAAAIDQGKVTPSSQYHIPYTMDFRGNRIKDSHPHPDQRLTLAGVLQHSSNVGTVQIANTLTPQVRYDYLRRFGLGQRTGVQMPNESPGLLRPPSQWRGRTVYTTAFGQGYAVTALQVTSAVGAIANGGVRVQPTVIRGTRAEDGSIRLAPRGEQTRVMSPATAQTMVALMDNDVPDDGKQNANVPHYAVAGKTGTAQAADGTYTASFIGFAPADRPDIVIGVFVYGIKSFIPGNTAAAPAWAKIMQYALQEQRLPPTGKPGTTLPTEW